MNNENFEKFRKAIEDMENSKGCKINSAAYILESGFIAMVINFGELKKICSNVPVFSVEQKRSGESRKFMINALRIFSNYLTSVTAFTSHTRNFIKNIYGGETDNAFDGKYQKEVDEKFKNNELAQFIEDLRNFYQHYKPLPIGITTKVNNSKNLYSKLTLSRKLLLNSDYIWEKGKKFINGIDDDIDIFQISEDYLFKTLFPWIMQQQHEYHKEEFEEFKRLQKIAKEFYDKK